MYALSQLASFLRGVAVFTLLVLQPVTEIAEPIPSPSTQVDVSATASANPEKFVVKETNQVMPQLAQAKPKPRSTPTDQYVLESHPSGEEGFYVLKNTPDEPMASVEEVNAAVNSYRQAHGLNKLNIDPQLCEIANQRAGEAAVHFSHQEFQQHIENGDYNDTGFVQIGENLWQGSFSGVHIVEFGWDQSPGHRANLQGDWSRGCAGVYQTTVAFTFAR